MSHRTEQCSLLFRSVRFVNYALLSQKLLLFPLAAGFGPDEEFEYPGGLAGQRIRHTLHNLSLIPRKEEPQRNNVRTKTR